MGQLAREELEQRMERPRASSVFPPTLSDRGVCDASPARIVRGGFALHPIGAGVKMDAQEAAHKGTRQLPLYG